jgi:transcriptional regulator with XRE-family HTH domain
VRPWGVGGAGWWGAGLGGHDAGGVVEVEPVVAVGLDGVGGDAGGVAGALARIVVLEPEALGQRRNDLAHALRELRQRAGLTGDRLAARSGMSQSKISKIETGRVLPSLADVERLLTALNAQSGLVDEIYTLARVANTEYADLRASLRRGLHHKRGQDNVRFVAGLGPVPDAKDVEIAMLRRQSMVLRRQVTRPRHARRSRARRPRR